MSKLLTLLEGRRANMVTERDGILDNATPETFTAEVEARSNELDDEIRALDARIAEVKATEDAEKRAAAVTPTVEVTSEPNPVYRKDNLEHQYFRDLFLAGVRGESAARTRLIDSQERALSTSATAGGTFAPPLWLVDEYVAYARAARTTADIIGFDDLPSGVSSINLPKVATGTATGVVQTQNTAVQNTDLTTTSVSSGISTISGQQVVALQLIQQSGIPFDTVVLKDLAADYASKLNVQVLTGTGTNGQLRGLATAGVAVTFTTTQPAVISSTAANSLYSKLSAAKLGVTRGRFLPATHIVMAPERWEWILNAVDTAGRPLVVPNGPAFNQLGITGEPTSQGPAGTMAGLPVHVDPLIPLNLGAGTNQDEIFVFRAPELYGWETPVQQAAFDATYANQNSILFRVLGYAALIPDRYQAAVQVIGGTGLVAPTF